MLAEAGAGAGDDDDLPLGAANLTTLDGLDDLESESSGANWRAVTATTSLKFQKTLEERRSVSTAF